MKRSLFLYAVLAPLSLLACEKSGADAQQKADKAQGEANREMNQAAGEATTRITNAQVEADKKIADAEKDFAKTREDYRHDVVTKLADLDKKLADLDAKALKATGKKKADLDANLRGLHARRDAFVADFQAMDRDTALTWDTSKARLDKEWSDLKASVDKVD